jgi:hypothetical protein
MYILLVTPHPCPQLIPPTDRRRRRVAALPHSRWSHRLSDIYTRHTHTHISTTLTHMACVHRDQKLERNSS